MCGLSPESAFFGSSWLPLGMFVGGVLLLGVMGGLLVIWLTLHVSPPWLFLSRQAWQHDWRGDGFPTFGEECDGEEANIA